MEKKTKAAAKKITTTTVNEIEVAGVPLLLQSKENGKTIIGFAGTRISHKEYDSEQEAARAVERQPIDLMVGIAAAIATIIINEKIQQK